jgi:hypothetical protein
MMQAARNLTNPIDRFLRYKQYLLMDRDTKCCEAAIEAIEDFGHTIVKLALDGRKPQWKLRAPGYC